MFRESVQKAAGTLAVEYESNTIDFSKFERVSMREAILKHKPDAQIVESKMIELFDEFVEPNLIQPTFIVDFPKSISPLSKASSMNLSDR